MPVGSVPGSTAVAPAAGAVFDVHLLGRYS